MKNINIRCILAGIFALFIGSALTGCIKEPESARIDKYVVLHLDLNIPGAPLMSRSMTETQESAIDYASIQVLVFEATPLGEVFRTKAVITDRMPPQITVNVPISTKSEQYRLVVITNMPEQTIADGTDKEAALNQYLFDCVGRWNASEGNPMKFPMWGESATTFAITGDRQLGISLHRALARVDVGTLFKFNNPNPITGEEYQHSDVDKESVWGLDNFKIKEILVYRTRNMAYAASSESKISGAEVIAPNIPAEALFNSENGTALRTLEEADLNPLVYTLETSGDSFIREIYIPESSVIDAGSNSGNVPCIVVGGFYGQGNVSDITYYRADFATYSNGTVIAYRPILRNHRYVFDILSASGPGSPTPEKALNSIDTRLNINVVEWNEVPLNYYLGNSYFLSISNRHVSLEAQAQGGALENSTEMDYDTDLYLDGSTAAKSMTYSWETGGLFDAKIDYVNRKFIFTPLSDNVGPNSVPRTDILTVKVKDVEFTIYVTQEAFTLQYDLDCGSVKVFGKYTEGTTLNYSHHIKLNLNSSVNLTGARYEINTAEKNGIHFAAEGYFPSVTSSGGKYVYMIDLQGFGMLVNDSGSDVLTSFDVEIVTNSTNNSSCTATVSVGYKTKKILTIGANAAYEFGYVLEPNSASRAFVDAAVNFGPNPDSRVTMATNESGNAFTIEVMTESSGMTLNVIDYAYLSEKLNTFKPDIILTGQAINYFTSGSNANVIELLNSFVDAGGVFIMCNEYYPSAASINAMVSRIMGLVSGNNQSIGNNQLFSLPAGVEYEDDPILNGPFGDMRGRQWGSDGHELHGFTGLPAETIIYSTRTNGAVCMFRHPTKGFFFVGDGGFISNNQRHIGNVYQGSYVYFPFAIDAQYMPVPRINYTVGKNTAVYNSQIFGNILAWAVDYSERHANP